MCDEAIIVMPNTVVTGVACCFATSGAPTCWPSNPFLCELSVVVFVNHLQEGTSSGIDFASQTLGHAFAYRHELEVLPARIARIVAPVSLRYLVVPQWEEPRREQMQRLGDTDRAPAAP